LTDDYKKSISDLAPLRDVIKEHGLRAEKSLGQNFLLDLNLTSKIARCARTIDNKTVFEIGPGPGGLTRSLLLTDARNVIAIEFDNRAISALESLKNAAQERFHIVHGDALSSDLEDLGKNFQSSAPYIVVANLPYNIATPLLVQWLFKIYQNETLFSELVLMFQKEVAQRIVAKPSTKAYGRLSILTQWLCEIDV
jgi:16S rRNA (adenine1518-N6/adenine1519-N6)-dimethyltransferase